MPAAGRPCFLTYSPVMPFTLPTGSTVIDLALRVHRQFEQTLKSARVWGSGKYEGIYVKRDHVLQDKDVVELHM